MNIAEVQLNGKAISFGYDDKRIGLAVSGLKAKDHLLTIDYRTRPQKALYFLGWQDDLAGNEQVWSQGQGQNNSHWIPSFEDLKRKMTYTLRFQAPQGYTLLSNGVLNKEESNPDQGTWVYEQKQPISGYLLALAVGKYREYKQTSALGTPLLQYLYPGDSASYQATFGSTKKVFDLLSESIGVSYPFENYKEVPVFDFLYAGMENASCTLFSDQYITDSLALPEESYLRVQAHELAHQWWGNLVTEQSGADHWLHEGFATFYAQEVERQIRGEDWYHWYMLDKALQLEKAKGESLLNPKASSLTFYEKGAWALTLLKEKLGVRQFRSSLARVLEKYRFRNLSVADFLEEIDWNSPGERKRFEETWLNTEEFPADEVEAWLAPKDKEIKSFYLLKNRLGNEKDSVHRLNLIREQWNKFAHPPHRFFMLSEYPEAFSVELLTAGLSVVQADESEYGRRLRRAIVTAIEQIPAKHYGLLKDQLASPDPITREIAMVRLWVQFPEKRREVLEAAESRRIGGEDRFLITRTALYLLSAEEREESVKAYNELMNYLKTNYNGDTRLYACTTLLSILPNPPTELLSALLELSVHHRWQIRTQAGRVLMSRLGDEEIRKWYEKALPLRSEREQKRLTELLELSKTQP